MLSNPKNALHDPYAKNNFSVSAKEVWPGVSHRYYLKLSPVWLG